MDSNATNWPNHEPTLDNMIQYWSFFKLFLQMIPDDMGSIALGTTVSYGSIDYRNYQIEI